VLGLAGLLALAGAVTYISISLCLVSPAEIKLAALAASWGKEKICHEDCAAARQQDATAVIADLKADPDSRAARRLREYFLSAAASPDFQAELVRILAAAAGADNPPDYVKDYFQRSDGSPLVQSAILSFFRPSALGASASAGSVASTSPLAGYFSILGGDSDLSVKQAAVEALSNESDKAGNFSAGQLRSLRGLILDPATPRRLRQSLVLLLGDYLPLFPGAAASILHSVYQSGVGGDEVSRAFSADILNRLAGAKLVLPPVSPEAWAEYYDN